MPIIHALYDAEVIDMAFASYTAPGSKSNRTTRIRAADILQDWFAQAKFEREDVGRAEGEEVIVLKNKNFKLIEYEDTPEIEHMREEVLAYNKLIASSFIDIPSLEDPCIVIEDIAKTRNVRIDGNDIRIRRIFSRSSWELNGRFYGAWWQQVDGDWRAKIFINDTPTVEVDFQGLHINLIYAELGEDLVGDPYDCSQIKIPGYPQSSVRMLVKRLALIAINAKDKSSAYRAFRESFSGGQTGTHMTNEWLDRLLDGFLTRNPKLTDYLFSDKGVELMRVDSKITAYIHRHFTEQGILILSVHDSYIIDYSKVAEMRAVMAEASEAITGGPLPTSIKLPDMPEYSEVSDQQVLDHIRSRHEERCQGYLDRLERHAVRFISE
ncbi:hypothetical protein [Parasedimentitalea psychrophila]|uniref:Uncharacterized protein n=1 Tax=Parasedimentitalea psychrophila TaxID=2997337 RepID=A0A9Y2P5A2_9RHOB|nr:hypothetical protein [Parasedimentitalea psychrophila]WIY26144.1 hypothetical protein QPJ95_04250 [Parasedimentitalea psychrophila]